MCSGVRSRDRNGQDDLVDGVLLLLLLFIRIFIYWCKRVRVRFQKYTVTSKLLVLLLLSLLLFIIKLLMGNRVKRERDNGDFVFHRSSCNVVSVRCIGEK